MIRNDVVSVTRLGTPIFPSSVSFVKGVGKGFNTVTLSGSELTPDVGDELVITVNGEASTVLVNSKDFGSFGKVSLQCYGLPCVLNDESPSDTLQTYIDSDSLIADNVGAIPVVNNIPNISLVGQAYSKSSTPMGMIADMVSVIGGEVWENNGVLNLQPLTTITSTPTIAHTFNDSEIFDHAYSHQRGVTKKVGTVHINPIHDTIVGETNVTILFGEVTLGSTAKSGQVLFVPSLVSTMPYNVSGFTPYERYLAEQEQFVLSNETVIYTQAGIDAVDVILLDGEPLTTSDYTFYPTWNAIKFTNLTTGHLTVTYQTKGLVFNVLRTTSVIASYGCMVASGVIEINSSSSNSPTNPDDDGYQKPSDKANEVIRPDYVDIVSLSYNKGGIVDCSIGTNVTLVFAESFGAPNKKTISSFSNGGGSITVKYIYNSLWSESWMNNISATTVTTKATKSGRVNNDPELGAIVYLDGDVKSITAVYFGHQLVTGWSYHGNGGNSYLSFSSTYIGKSITIAVTVDVNRITIPSIPISDPTAHSLDAFTANNLVSRDILLEEETGVTLPSTFDLDVASLLNVSIDEADGKVLTGDFGNLTVNEVGTVSITVATQGKFTINSGNVKKGTLIKINSEGADYA